jgi:hypothetical protein
MPPLSATLRSESPEGFAAAENNPSEAAPASVAGGRPQGGNPYIRCPLPPFNAGPDTLRQFNENGKIPTRRVIPLPIQVSSGGTTTVTNNTTVIQQGGSGGGGSSTNTTLQSKSATLLVPSLGPGGVFTGTLVMARAFKLQQLSSSVPVEVRMYGDPGTQGSDIVRASDTAVPFEVTAGIITDVIFDTAPYVWSWQNRTGNNADSPQTSNVYITVVNPSTSTATSSGSVTVQFLVEN